MTEFTHDFTTDIRSINERLLSIEHAIDNLSLPLLSLSEVYNEPTRPRNGQIVFADGTQWDPGSGRGIYIYNGNGSNWAQWISLP
jgi:hypothetical protein